MSTHDFRLPEDLEKLVDPAVLRRPDDLTVACYTFPQYHPSELNDKLIAKGWTEYVTIRGARPWYDGHHQPRTPLLGQLNEAEPSTWETYNALALEYGVDVFIWDWYWYDDRPALHEALEQGFLRAFSSRRMKFAVMWTNHPWNLWVPHVDPDRTAHYPFAYRAPERPEDVWRSLTYIISRYFHLENYWRPDGRPFLAVWEAERLKESFGVAGTRALLDELRDVARKMGHAGIHFHATQGSWPVFPELEAMGFDSYGHYNPIIGAADGRPVHEETVDYSVAAAEVITRIWPEADASSPLPAFPGVSPGWDPTPRCVRPARSGSGDRRIWPGTLIVRDESPAAFEALVRGAFAYLNARPDVPNILTIGCWNEWTEGHYLLPDTRLGYGMLEALGRALGKETTRARSEGSVLFYRLSES